MQYKNVTLVFRNRGKKNRRDAKGKSRRRRIEQIVIRKKGNSSTAIK